MATLRIDWDKFTSNDLWSWDSALKGVHKSARIIRRMRNQAFLAHLGPRDGEATEVVILKFARGSPQFEWLANEAEFYAHDLRHLQGTVVPISFGFYRGKHHGKDIACLLLEHCSGMTPIWDMKEFNRQIMLAAWEIHEAGVNHGNLVDGRHFVNMGHGVRIVDFSTAVRHECPMTATYDLGRCLRCEELVQLDKMFGRFSPTSVSKEAAARVPLHWS